MKRYKFILLSTVIILLLSSCGEGQLKEKKTTLADTTKLEQIVNQDSIGTLDTTITLLIPAISKYHGINLTDSLAKEILYRYCQKKGYLISDRLPELLKESDYKKISVQYDTVFFADLNSNKYTDAIISYWLAPLGASGNCLQPHKAAIIDTDNGYKILNEEFIPPNFAMDSVVTSNTGTIIFAYDYDCANHEVIRHLRVTINQIKNP